MPAELARCALAANTLPDGEADDDAAAGLVGALQANGLSPETIVADVFEPAARCLGDLWQQDVCSEFELTAALCRLQALARRLADGFQQSHAGLARRHVLIATAPGETHMLALALSSEFYWRAGWDVTCALPANDAELCRLLQGQHVDVLELSLSPSFRRTQRLDALRDSVRAARRNASNSALVVLASGRMFFERPEFGLLAGADAAAGSAAGAVALAEGLLGALVTPGFAAAHQALREVAERVGVFSAAR